MKMTALAALALLAAAPAGMTRGPDGDDMATRLAGPPSGTQTRYAPFQPSTYDAEARTVELILSVGAAVNRRWFVEELEISSEAVDVGRVGRGLVPLLDSHNRWGVGAVLGQVVSTRFETISGVVNLIAMARFADTEAGRAAEGMVARGELRGVSIGYDPKKWECTHVDAETEIRTWRATSWELLEASLVPVPADPAAGVRSAPQSPGSTTSNGANATQETDEMIRSRLMGGVAATALAANFAPPDDTAAAAGASPAVSETRAAPPAPQVPAQAAEAAPSGGEAARAAPNSAGAPPTGQVTRFSASDAVQFTRDATAFGLAERADALVAQNERGEISVETARAQLLREAGEAQRAATAAAPQAPAYGAAGRSSDANSLATRQQAVDAIVARVLGTTPDPACREFVGLRLLELAAVRSGVSPRERDPYVILRAAQTSSDFPLILEAAANKILLTRYELAVPTFRAIARRRDLQDFKPTKLLNMGDFPTLLPYAEDGEIKSGTINEGRESVVLGSYGRILRLTRQAIVNDDLGAFDDVFNSIGSMIAQFENATFWAIHALNSGLGPKLSDGKTLFHADHGNVAASGAAPAIATLGVGRAAMRKQKNIDGNVMNVAAKYIVVGPDLETAVDQLVASISPAITGEVNPFAGKLTPVVEGSIVGNSWELYADPAMAPVWHYGYLAGAPGPRVMTQEQFNTDGVAFRATLDFYADATDYRGAFRNAGAA